MDVVAAVIKIIYTTFHCSHICYQSHLESGDKNVAQSVNGGGNIIAVENYRGKIRTLSQLIAVPAANIRENVIYPDNTLAWVIIRGTSGSNGNREQRYSMLSLRDTFSYNRSTGQVDDPLCPSRSWVISIRSTPKRSYPYTKDWLRSAMLFASWKNIGDVLARREG